MLFARSGRDKTSPTSCRDGGIGRRSGLKIRRGQPLASSSLAPGTKLNQGFVKMAHGRSQTLFCVFLPFIPLLSALHQRRGQAPSIGRFSDSFLNNSPAISAAQNAHTQAIIFEVAKAIRTPLDQLHFTVKTFCDAVISGKPEHSGHFFPPIMQRLTQGAQWREGRFSKVINFI